MRALLLEAVDRQVVGHLATPMCARKLAPYCPFSTTFGAPGAVMTQPPHRQRNTCCTCSCLTNLAGTNSHTKVLLPGASA
ncbi:MAG: hypothetical protein BGO98_02030 [Myxococcales bacterium 68-20]|nr:MAG: hypothetical protein BGO98_02030 [Myxococcales bacterium 68-20]